MPAALVALDIMSFVKASIAVTNKKGDKGSPLLNTPQEYH